MALLLSLMSVLLAAVFTGLIFMQWRQRRRVHQLLWSFAMLVWTVAVAAETVAAARGYWDPATYRFYYAFGALMVAPWLGVGSLYLAAPRRWAHASFLLALTLTVVGFVGIFSHRVPADLLVATDELGFVETRIFPMMPTRLAIILGNIFGSAAFVGSALYSVYGFWRKQIMRDRMVGVALIAAGGMLAAVTHSIGAMGGPALFRVSQFVALLLIFIGYVRSNSTVSRSAPERVLV